MTTSRQLRAGRTAAGLGYLIIGERERARESQSASVSHVAAVPEQTVIVKSSQRLTQRDWTSVVDGKGALS
ncbi:hypothetical protein VPNG_02812 [Cytospora leucostoma]|uniref:Uncharacterized protein n=1 Tax=Cytospora leucostoma TaxID=1230097 RepID=A0A423XKG7_9PEZI|nr:hypothetical protein VPNG_02812 [Cytospora leucostoma]